MEGDGVYQGAVRVVQIPPCHPFGINNESNAVVWTGEPLVHWPAQPSWRLSMSAEPVGESTEEIRPLRISPELARELLRVLREEDLELPEDSTVLAVIVEPHPARQPAPSQRPEDGIEGLIGVLGDLDAPVDASERVDEYVYGHR